LERILDLDRFHSFLALEALTCHWDGYAASRNNYRLYRDPAQSRFVFMPHGMDQMFGRPQAPFMMDCSGLVAWAVLNTPEGRQRHREGCAQLFSEVFLIERLTNRVAALQQRLRPVLEQIDPKRARRHDEAVDKLRRQIVERASFLEARLKASPVPVTFNSNGVAALSGWMPFLTGGEARLSEITEPAPSLVVSNVGTHIPFVASWRTVVRLPAGHYRFEGVAEVTGLTPAGKGPGSGVTLRTFGFPPASTTPIQSEAASQKLAFEFATSSEQVVELICEVRAFRGVVQCNRESLRLVRVSTAP
jgi:hypothetical protein